MTALRLSMITQLGGHRVRLSVDGLRIETPPLEHLAFYAGLGLLAAVEIIEWPLAITLSVGHLLMEATHRPGLQALGAALEEA